MGMAFAKEIMIRRGVFKNNRVRGETKPLDAGRLCARSTASGRASSLHLIWHKKLSAIASAA